LIRGIASTEIIAASPERNNPLRVAARVIYGVAFGYPDVVMFWNAAWSLRVQYFLHDLLT
jgi:hypothetical protein